MTLGDLLLRPLRGIASIATGDDLADTTRTPLPSICCTATTQESVGGSCTRETRGGTSGTVTSMRILPANSSCKFDKVDIWAAKGTVKTAMPAAATPSRFSFPETRSSPRMALSSQATALALFASREPIVT